MSEQAPLTVFALKLWDARALVVAADADAAKRMLADKHHFRGAWVRSPSVTIEEFGRDSIFGWEKRASAGGAIMSVTNPPPRPHKQGDTELINDLRKENRNK